MHHPSQNIYYSRVLDVHKIERYRYRDRYRNRYRYRNIMAFGHENLDVYRLAIDYVAWVYRQANALTGIHRHARNQWLRASQSIPLNIAEGNAKAAEADCRRYFEIARGSAVECAAG